MIIWSRPLPSLTILGLGLTALLLAAGCGSKNSTDATDTQLGGMHFDANPSTITAGENSTLTFKALDNKGQPYAGAFFTLTTTLGILDPTSGQTDASGTFVTILHTSPTDHGKASVKVWYGGYTFPVFTFEVSIR